MARIDSRPPRPAKPSTQRSPFFAPHLARALARLRTPEERSPFLPPRPDPRKF